MSDVTNMRRLIEELEEEGVNPLLCSQLHDALNAIARNLSQARDRHALVAQERSYFREAWCRVREVVLEFEGE